MTIEDDLLSKVKFNEELDRESRDSIPIFKDMINKSEEKKWIADLLNAIYNPEKKLTEEDFGRLRVILNPGEMLNAFSEYYEHEFWRVVFSTILEDIINITSRIRPTPAASIHFSIYERPKGFNGYCPSSLCLVYSTAKNNMFHELRHSIDPNVKNRKKGIDRILDEIVAYWGNLIFPQFSSKLYAINPRTLETKVMANPPKSIEEIQLYIRETDYRAQFGLNNHSMEEYKAAVDQVFKIIKELSEFYSIQEMDTIFLNATSVKQLETLALFKKMQKINVRS